MCMSSRAARNNCKHKYRSSKDNDTTNGRRSTVSRQELSLRGSKLASCGFNPDAVQHVKLLTLHHLRFCVAGFCCPGGQKTSQLQLGYSPELGPRHWCCCHDSLQSGKCTALHFAATQGATEIVKLMISSYSGSNDIINAVDGNQETLLHRQLSLLCRHF